jgi:hypothetical protein
VQRIRDAGVTSWLEAAAGHGATGYDPGGWPASTWILHAMYELPFGRVPAPVEMPPPETELEAELDAASALTSPLGPTERPGLMWRRLRWSALARRAGVDPFARAEYPCSTSFPYESWTDRIQPPGEGCLDRFQFVRLVRHLAARGGAASCFALFAQLTTSVFEEETVYRGPVHTLLALYDDDDQPGWPTNLWAEDRSWFVYSDYDLWATKVSGEPALIDALTADRTLETVALAR